MRYILLVAVCLDLFLAHGISLAQESPFLSPHPFLTVWGGGIIRAALLLLISFVFSSTLPWISQCVLCFHVPVYTSLLWALGYPTTEELWTWHSWIRVLQGYVVTALAYVYWTRHVSVWTQSMSFWFRRSSPETAEKDRPVQRLLGYMQPYSWQFAFVLVLVILSSCGEMAFPQYTGRVADWIMNKEAPDAFTEAITYMIIMTVGSAVLEFICDLTYNGTMNHIHTIFQGEVFRAVLKQEIAFFQATTTGALVSRITTSTNETSEALSETLSLLMWYLARFAFILFFMVRQSGKMTLLTCMALPIIWVIPELIGHFHQTISKKVQESLAKANQVATETFSNMKTVRSFANEDGETERYKKCLDDTYTLNKREALAYAGTSWANSMTTLALKVSILYYGGTLVTRGTVTGGDLVSFILYELQFASAVEAVMRCYPEIKKAVGASEKNFEYLDRTPDIPPDGSLAPDKLIKEIEFRNVKFSYSDNQDENNLVLKGASFKIHLGKTNALVGRNGSGKSTCIKLLERFYQPQDGQILLDGELLKNYKKQYLHEKIAVVSQDCLLFARPVKDNIKYGFEKASEEDMTSAAKLACAHDFITTLLSSGYNTDAGERGGQVSGGQKQRIAIARALIRRPQILILDNATSDLDSETEKKVHEALLKMPNHHTVLLISNKMDAVKNADHIICLDNGQVMEEGSHEELLKLGGFYADLVEKQNASFEKHDEHIGNTK